MSEESSITVEQKEKNPKRVEGGKRLAAYNKAAREKMNATRTNIESVENIPTNTEGNETAFPLLIIGVLGVSGLAYLFFTHHKSNKTVVKDTEVNMEQQEQEQPKTRLRSLD